jgi:hypothetical protein
MNLLIFICILKKLKLKDVELENLKETFESIKK